MTRTQRTIVLHWRGIAVLCAIVALFGIAWATWHRMDTADRNYAAAKMEADRRGGAVSTLSGDVRALREQIKAMGETPVAEDPSKAVKDLPDRTEVPVPIPGPQGVQGVPGKNGKDGEDGADSTVPGPQGPAGQDSTVPGPAGPAGQDGTNGKDGSPPASWTWTDSKGVTYTCTRVDGFDPDAPRYHCVSDEPEPSGEPSSVALTTFLATATYRRL